MKQLLTNLFEHRKLSRETARQILIDISEARYNDAQIASFITVYLMRAITVDELQGFRDALLELCLPVDLEGRETVDMVGTGGDGKNTFNITTASAFLVAGAGYQVTKHGNYGVSSFCGSSNVLEKLGYRFTNDAEVLKRQLDRANICFFHAPLFHPAMKTVAPVRRSLGVKTFFNMLGPLVNPAQPKYQLFGVFNLQLARLYQYLLQQSEKSFAVVFALDGYDEVSLTGPFQWRTRQGEAILEPADLGLAEYQADELSGGHSITDAAAIFLGLLQGKGTPAQKDVVVANAGATIRAMYPDRSWENCLAEARESLDSGRALRCLQNLLKDQ